jgi:hypothetical protein
MTNWEFLTQKENIKELAKSLIQMGVEEDIDYDWDESPYLRGIIYYPICSDGESFCYGYSTEIDDEAIEHEIEWLLKEKE